MHPPKETHTNSSGGLTQALLAWCRPRLNWREHPTQHTCTLKHCPIPLTQKNNEQGGHDVPGWAGTEEPATHHMGGGGWLRPPSPRPQWQQPPFPHTTSATDKRICPPPKRPPGHPLKAYNAQPTHGRAQPIWEDHRTVGKAPNAPTKQKNKTQTKKHVFHAHGLPSTSLTTPRQSAPTTYHTHTMTVGSCSPRFARSRCCQGRSSRQPDHTAVVGTTRHGTHMSCPLTFGAVAKRENKRTLTHSCKLRDPCHPTPSPSPSTQGGAYGL
jgi:hypothetical protein